MPGCVPPGIVLVGFCLTVSSFTAALKCDFFRGPLLIRVKLLSCGLAWGNNVLLTKAIL